MEINPQQTLSVVHLPDGVSLELPPRNLGKARYVGLAPIAFGLVFSGFAVFWTYSASRGMIGSGGQFHWFPAIFALWGVPFILAGFMPIGIGLAILYGRSRIQFANNQLKSVELVGPFRWARARKIDGLASLVVTRGDQISARAAGRQPSPSTLQNFVALQARFETGKPFMLAMGYPAPLLQQAADELSRRIARGNIMVQTPHTVLVGHDDSIHATPDGTPGGSGIPVVVEEIGASTEATRRQPYPQPAETKCTLIRNPEGITITIPPAGLFKGSHGLFFFALLWCGFMTFFTIAAGSAIFSGSGFTTKGGQAVSALLPVLFIAGFWAIGIGLLIAAINMARRKVIFDVIAPGTDAAVLLVTQQSLRGARQQEWPRADIAAVIVGPSGMEVNDRPVMQVQILLPRDKKKKAGYLTGRPVAELHWIAWELHQALALENGNPTDSAPA